MSAALPSIEARREKALENFHVRGMPHRRFEHWRYSDLRAVLDAGQVAQAGTAKWQVENLPQGVELFDLAAPADAPEWVVRNLALSAIGRRWKRRRWPLRMAGWRCAWRAGRKLLNRCGYKLRRPGNLRLLVVLEEGASLTLMETHTVDAGLLRNVGVEIALGAAAKLTHVRLAAGAPKSITVEHIAVAEARGAQYRAHFANFGAKLSRTEASHRPA